MNELFKVDKLDDLTREHFSMACVAAMTEEEELRGLLGVPCGDDYLLWAGEGSAKVEVRNWSRMLTLFIVSKNGTWLTSDHIDGMGAEAVIDEAYRRFTVAKPYIEHELEKAFTPVKLKEGAVKSWTENVEAYARKVKDFVKKCDRK